MKKLVLALAVILCLPVVTTASNLSLSFELPNSLAIDFHGNAKSRATFYVDGNIYRDYARLSVGLHYDLGTNGTGPYARLGPQVTIFDAPLMPNALGASAAIGYKHAFIRNAYVFGEARMAIDFVRLGSKFAPGFPLPTIGVRSGLGYSW